MLAGQVLVVLLTIIPHHPASSRIIRTEDTWEMTEMTEMTETTETTETGRVRDGNATQ